MNILKATRKCVLLPRCARFNGHEKERRRAPVLRWHVDAGLKRIECRWVVQVDDPCVAASGPMPLAARIEAILRSPSR